MEIDTDDLSGAQVQGFLAGHLTDMRDQGPRRARTRWTWTACGGRA
ncbi:hypothetical protein [Pseudonocardia sp. ICBG1293]|nr:hypothetical protein [Pseudonocardia sp. ICBG1293]